jgi:hypothetical protein
MRRRVMQKASSFLRASSPAFRPGRKRVLSLRADVFGDDGQRSATARGGEVGRGPQHAVVVATRHFGPGFSQPTARYALQAVDELGEGDLGRIAHQQVNVVVLPGARHQLRLEVAADLGEDAGEIADCESRKHIATVFGDKDQVRVQVVNDMPSPTDFHVAAPETNL